MLRVNCSEQKAPPSGFAVSFVRTSKGSMIAKNAELISQQHIRVLSGSMIHKNVSIHGNLAPVNIGRFCILKENCALQPGKHLGKVLPLTVGDFCTIGKQAQIHSVSIGSYCDIEEGVILLEGTILGECCQILKSSTLLAGTVVPSYTIWSGTPAVLVGYLPPSQQLAQKHRVNESVQRLQANATMGKHH